MANLQLRIQARMDELNFLQFSDNDIFAILNNILKHQGEDCFDENIDEEIELFYNA